MDLAMACTFRTHARLSGHMQLLPEDCIQAVSHEVKVLHVFTYASSCTSCTCDPAHALPCTQGAATCHSGRTQLMHH